MPWRIHWLQHGPQGEVRHWPGEISYWMTFIGRYTAEVCVCLNFRRSLPLTVLLWVQAFFASLILFDSLMLYRHLLPAVFSCSSSCGEHRPRFLSNLNRPVPSAWATSMARWLPSLALNMSYPNIDPDSKPFLIVSSLLYFFMCLFYIYKFSQEVENCLFSFVCA